VKTFNLERASMLHHEHPADKAKCVDCHRSILAARHPGGGGRGAPADARETCLRCHKVPMVRAPRGATEPEGEPEPCHPRRRPTDGGGGARPGQGFLASLPGFAAAAERDLERFVGQCALARVGPGSRWSARPSTATTCCWFLSGSVLVRLRRPSGGDTVLALLRRGEIFGELSALGQTAAGHPTVVSNERAELVVARREPLGRADEGHAGPAPAPRPALPPSRHRRQHLRDPLFEALPPDALERLIDLARLRAYDQDQW